MDAHTSQPPKGFTVIAESADQLTVTYKSTGIGCLLAFLIVCIVGLIGGLLLVNVTQPGAIRFLIFAAWWTPFAFAACVCSIVYFSSFIIFHVFGATTFTATDQALTISRRVFGLSRTQHISRDGLVCLEQTKDGGEGEDSFPTWGLRLVGRRKHWLLCRQEIDKSDWLGPLFAERLNIEYRPTDKRPTVGDDGT